VKRGIEPDLRGDDLRTGLEARAEQMQRKAEPAGRAGAGQRASASFSDWPARTAATASSNERRGVIAMIIDVGDFVLISWIVSMPACGVGVSMSTSATEKNCRSIRRSAAIGSAKHVTWTCASDNSCAMPACTPSSASRTSTSRPTSACAAVCESCRNDPDEDTE